MSRDPWEGTIAFLAALGELRKDSPKVYTLKPGFSIHVDLYEPEACVSPLPRVETPATEDVDGASSVAPLTPKEEQ